MGKRVKNTAGEPTGAPPRSGPQIHATTAARPKPPAARTRISSKHQVTIAKAAFDQAGLKAGDVLTVRAVGPGRVELTSLDALLERYRGSLSTGGEFRRFVERSRREWA